MRWYHLDMTWWILFTIVVSLISFFVNYIHPGVKKHEYIREWKQNWKPGWLGICMYSAQLPFFLGVFPGKEGPMNLKVSKSHSRCVATRQLIPRHQLTFLSTSALHGLHQIRNWTRGMFYLHSRLLPSEHLVGLNVCHTIIGMLLPSV